MSKIIGWDVGGANLKAVLLGEQGELLYVKQLACPLWLGLEQLTESITSMLELFGCRAHSVKHAVTMTGELVDLFNNRQEGVIKIAKCLSKHLGQDILFYQMDDHKQQASFVSIDMVSISSSAIASANWHASASLAAKKYPFSLLIDIGSTTTDIISIINGQVVSSNWTDAERLQQDALLYTGVVRTPLMAIAQKIEVDSKMSNVAAEYFATTADVFRLTGELDNSYDNAPTPDGAAKTLDASARRLARMVGYDFEDKPLEVWHALAHAFRKKQLNQISSAIQKHLAHNTMIVGTGAGQFLVKEAANMLNQPYSNLAALFDLELPQEVDICFPAFAIAKLALESELL